MPTASSFFSKLRVSKHAISTAAFFRKHRDNSAVHSCSVYTGRLERVRTQLTRGRLYLTQNGSHEKKTSKNFPYLSSKTLWKLCDLWEGQVKVLHQQSFIMDQSDRKTSLIEVSLQNFNNM